MIDNDRSHLSPEEKASQSNAKRHANNVEYKNYLNKKISEKRKEQKNITPEQQIEKLDKMFGVGKGTKKERKKLEKKILSR